MRLCYVVGLLLLGVVVGCDSSTPDTALGDPVNDHCPIMGGEVTADGGQAVWNGQVIGFCCPECQPAWEKLSDEEKSAKLAKAGDHSPEDGHSHDHGDHDHDAHGDHS